ncbi:MAG: PAS domain-containing protein [Kineosporiaceae bacterium]|nr:PAS domain-containing protein [Kineosporiaceae bacterium]
MTTSIPAAAPPHRPLRDMTTEEIVGTGRPHRLTYHDGTSRTVLVTDLETSFPTGELIVSQTDTDGVITMCNEAFVLMSGWSRAELLGSPHAILRHPDMPRAAFADLWATVGSGRRWSGYVKNLRRDGGFYWVYATVIPKIRAGVILGHTSVRRQPSRRRVEAAEALYATMRSEENDASRVQP